MNLNEPWEVVTKEWILPSDRGREKLTTNVLSPFPN
jgi:hypothetical protein